MSPRPSSFVDQFLRGDCVLNSVDDFVDQWHVGDSTLPLSEFLGFTPEEYAHWVECPDSLETILFARKTKLASVTIGKEKTNVPGN